MKKTIRLLFSLLLIISLSFCSVDIAQAKGRGGYRGYRKSSFGGGYKAKGSFKSYKTKSYKSKSSYSVPKKSYKSYPKKTYKTKSYKTYSPRSSIKRSYKQKSLYKSNFSNKQNKRSAIKKRKFLKSRGYKEAPSGYEVDHVVPLSKGGADEPYNMQLLPKEMHKQKTKMEQSGNKGYLFKR